MHEILEPKISKLVTGLLSALLSEFYDSEEVPWNIGKACNFVRNAAFHSKFGQNCDSFGIVAEFNGLYLS